MGGVRVHVSVCVIVCGCAGARTHLFVCVYTECVLRRVSQANELGIICGCQQPANRC